MAGRTQNNPFFTSNLNYDISRLPYPYRNWNRAYTDPGVISVHHAAGVVNISDEQMFSCVYAVQHFIQVWELTYGPALVQAGIAEKEKQLANARNNNYNNGR